VKVIIPVAGIGSRLRPHTHTVPKALLHVAGKPLLGHIIDSLKDLDFEKVTFVTGFLGDKIVDYVKSTFDFEADFVVQKELLGLGYAISLAVAQDESDDLLIILGDTIVDLNWSKFIEQGKNLIGVKTVKDPHRFGVAEVDGNKIQKLWEKPQKPPSDLALVGLYYIKETLLFKRCLDEIMSSNIKTKNEYQMTDALQLMLEKGAEMYSYPIEGWYDCGKKKTLLETNRHLLDSYNSCDFTLEGNVIIPPVFIDKSAVVENSIIGPYVSIAPKARVTNSVITNSIVAYEAKVKNGLLKNSLVGNMARVEGTFHTLNVGDSSEIGY